MSDLIKREDAIKAVAEVLSLNRFASFRNIKDFGRFAERMLRNVPSADRPQGEWIYTNNPLRLDDEWACNRCGNISFVKTNFCDRCGARMKGADDE